MNHMPQAKGQSPILQLLLFLSGQSQPGRNLEKCHPDRRYGWRYAPKQLSLQEAHSPAGLPGPP